MKSEKIANWLQIAANFGILLSLVFVGFQMRQDHQLAAADKQVETHNNLITFLSSSMGENLASAMSASATRPQSITPEELQVLMYYTAGAINILRRAAHLESLGLADSSWRVTVLPSMAEELGSNRVTRAIVLDIASKEDWLVSLQRIVGTSDPNKYAASFNSILASVVLER